MHSALLVFIITVLLIGAVFYVLLSFLLFASNTLTLYPAERLEFGGKLLKLAAFL